MPKELIYSVKAVTAIAISQNIVFVSAVGETRTSGWTRPELKPVIYVQPPPDGIQDFSFIATPPTTGTLQVLTPITAYYVWTKPPKWLKGVRVRTETNSKTAKIIKLSASLQAKAPKAKFTGIVIAGKKGNPKAKFTGIVTAGKKGK